MSQPTPGPYHVQGNSAFVEIVSEGGASVADCWPPLEGDATANANLLAASWDLRAALQALGAKPDGYCFCHSQEQIAAGHTGECRDARAALAKAKGGEA